MKMREFVLPKYVYASKNIRAVNFIIDIILIKLITNLALIITDHLTQDYLRSSWYNKLDLYEFYLLSTIIMFIYYFLTEKYFSRSLSKFITNTIVVKQDGTKPNTVDILARSALRIVPLEYFTFLRGRKPGMHDEYSNTFVVQKKKFEQSFKESQEI